MLRPNFIVDVDWSALEFVIVSILSNDVVSLEWIRNGQDAHNELAAIAFDKAVKDVLPMERRCLKHVRYGMTYGAGVKKIHKTIQLKGYPECPFIVAKRCVDTFKRTHTGVLKFQEELIKTAREHHYVEDPVTGRRIVFIGEPDITLTLNFPIQASGAGIMNPACKRAFYKLKEAQNGSLLIGQIHDSLVAESPDPLFAACTLREEMEREVTIREVTHSFLTETEIGLSNWGDMIKIKRIGKPGTETFKVDQKGSLFVSTYEDCVLEAASRLDYEWERKQ